MFELTFESADLLTQEEFAVWVAGRPASDPNRYELLGGRIVMNPPAGYFHGRSVRKASRTVGDFVEDRDLGVVFPPDQGFALPGGETVSPDFAIILKERWVDPPPLARGDFIALVPDLIIEVSSPGNARYDRGEKKGIYERNGVREYWLLDPNGRRLTVFRLDGSKFDLGRVFEEQDEVTCSMLPGLRLLIRDLLP